LLGLFVIGNRTRDTTPRVTKAAFIAQFLNLPG
jgi:hypothetical protein